MHAREQTSTASTSTTLSPALHASNSGRLFALSPDPRCSHFAIAFAPGTWLGKCAGCSAHGRSLLDLARSNLADALTNHSAQALAFARFVRLGHQLATPSFTQEPCTLARTPR